MRALFIALLLTACGGGHVPPQQNTGGCMGANALLASYGDNHIAVDAADFDGTNDYMTRSADLSGISDGKKGVLSFWYRVDSDGPPRYVLVNNSLSFIVVHQADNSIYVYGRNSASTVVQLFSTNAKTTSAAWLHILASWDSAVGAQNMYVNDVDELNTLVNTNDTIDYAGSASWNVGSFNTGDYKLNGCMAEMYFAPGQYLDLSIESNRRKFISSDGRPVFLGADGSVPTGTAPAIYLHLADGEAVANFAVNRGAGGDFTITGTLGSASSSPSD